MHNVILATRISIDGETTCRSHAGLSLRTQDGVVHTFLFQHTDSNIAIQVLGTGKAGDFLAIFHVFLGNYLNTLTITDYEVFRFHGDTWPAFLSRESWPRCYGELLYLLEGPVRTARHSYEHVGGLYLTDGMKLSASMQAGGSFTPAPRQYAPDADDYRALDPFIPHPGLVHGGDETESIESWLRYEHQGEQPYVM